MSCAPCEARTHDLQIMRLTRCRLRQRGTTQCTMQNMKVIIMYYIYCLNSTRFVRYLKIIISTIEK